MMKMNMTGAVIQATRYDMDGNKGGNITVTNQPDEQNQDRAGLDVMKMNAPYDTVEKLRKDLPCECDMEVEAVQGGGGKMSFKLLKITPKKKAV